MVVRLEEEEQTRAGVSTGGHFFSFPHGVFWTVIEASAMAYAILLVYLLWLPAHRARELIKVLDPVGAGMPTEEVTYAENCEFTPTNVTSSVDIFVVAHVLGWFFKAFILRNRALLWIQSICFELLEMSFQTSFPNFEECWWDRWLFDVAICNFVGIELGMRIVELILEPYQWFADSAIIKWELSSPFVKSRATPEKAVGYNENGGDAGRYQGSEFTTDHYDRYSPDQPESALRSHLRGFVRNLNHNWRRYIVLAGILFLLQLADLNAFFLKSTLWIEVESRLNFYRLFVVAPNGLIVLREVYGKICDPSKHLGLRQLKILIFILLTELAIVFKNFRGKDQTALIAGVPEFTPLLICIITSVLLVFSFVSSAAPGPKNVKSAAD